jgi:hypothetical protein
MRVPRVTRDEVGFAAFYEASRGPCLRAMCALVTDRRLAEDLVAEGFARAWAAWPKVISAGTNGTSALTLRKGEQYRLDPVALRQALARYGIPALVTVGKACDSSPEPTGLDQAVTPTRHPDGSVTLTINPREMPPGSELSIGYFTGRTVFALIQEGAPLHCDVPPGS